MPRPCFALAITGLQIVAKQTFPVAGLSLALCFAVRE
ncbi:hypothetical protein AWB66_05143 [Caballeronia telluris]|uniref:Uncharacterized protein n=1 Tax=Caballeronia telluris TaxID=326475 RepID=A0A158K209_9BURK|nr:hypothetical protein AWB66_05143 [Caballeronia telluris]